MIPTQAIEKAIEAGWKPKEPLCSVAQVYNIKDARKHLDDHTRLSSDAEIALDPSFWQALGKALGWNTIEQLDTKQIDHLRAIRIDPSAYQHDWKYQASRFYDLILTGGDTERFWADLLR